MQSRYDCWVNHNLEAIANQLYDYWFVQFDFPNEEGKPYKSSGGKMVWNEKLKREIPEGWKDITLNAFIDKNKSGDWGYDTPRDGTIKVGCVRGADIIKLNDVPTRHITSQHSDRLLEDGDIVVEISGGSPVQATGRVALITDGVIGRNGGALVCSNFCQSFSMKRRVFSEYFYYLWKNLYDNDNMFNFEGKTSGIKNFQIDVFLANHWFEPLKELIEAFHAVVSKYHLMIDQNIIENNNLTKRREELLPLLMNGQASVNYDLLFCPFAHFLYNATKNPMKEEVKTRIVTAMAQNLSPEQLLFLNTVLNDNFKGIEIKLLGDEVSQRNKANNELLNAFISAKKIEGCSDKTLHYYRSSIEALLAKLNKKIDVIVTNDIRNYLSDYQEERLSSRVTIDNLRRIFSSFFAWLEDEDYIGKSPVRRIHKVRTESLVKEVLSDENMEVLRDTCHEIRDLAMIDLLASTGMRVGELAKMNREDIDFQERQCVVFGKGNKEREVYFNARTKIHLKRYLESRKDTNPALFVSLSTPHNRLTISGVEVRLRQLGRKAGINKVHPHKFRRTLATMAIDKGMPIEQVQKLLGHVKIDTTLHYAMVNQTNVKIAHRKFIG